MKVLIIEDNEDLTLNMVNYLEQENIRCETAKNLFEAQDKLLAFQYDCILLDLMLPDGNGLDILSFVKSNQITANVLIVSAKNALDDRLRGLDLGADDYLPKPFHLSELLARLRAIYRRSKLDGSDQIIFNEINLDTKLLEAKVNQSVLDLTKKRVRPTPLFPNQ